MAKIFAELQGNYGSRFLNQWKTGQIMADGQDSGIANAMRVWSERLGGFEETPEAFALVLKGLPEEPPSLPQFVELCRQAAHRVRGNQAALPHKLTADEQQKADEAAKQVKQAVQKMGDRDQLAWAKRPGSHLALRMVMDGAKKDHRLREIFADLVRDGVATEDGVMLKRWDGNEGRWVKP